MQGGFGFGKAWERQSGYLGRIPSNLVRELQRPLTGLETSMVKKLGYNEAVLYLSLALHGAAGTLKRLLGKASRVSLAGYTIHEGLAWPQIRKWIGKPELLEGRSCSDSLVIECIGLDDMELLQTLMFFNHSCFQTCLYCLVLGSKRMIRYAFEYCVRERSSHTSTGHILGMVRDLSVIEIPEHFNVSDAQLTACEFGNIDTLRYLVKKYGIVSGGLISAVFMRREMIYKDPEVIIGLLDIILGNGVTADPANFGCFDTAMLLDSAELLEYLYEHGFPIRYGIGKRTYGRFKNSMRWLNDNFEFDAEMRITARKSGKK